MCVVLGGLVDGLFSFFLPMENTGRYSPHVCLNHFARAWFRQTGTSLVPTSDRFQRLGDFLEELLEELGREVVAEDHVVLCSIVVKCTRDPRRVEDDEVKGTLQGASETQRN